MSTQIDTDWSTVAERGSVGALRAMAWSYRLLGRRLSQLLLHPIVAYFFVREGASRHASRAYQEALWEHPEGRRNLASGGRRPGALAPLRHYYEFAVQIFDRMVLWGGGSRNFKMDSEGGRHLFALKEARRGAILLGAHLGSFDMARQLANEHGLPLNVVMFTAHAQRINRFFERLDRGSTVRVLELDPRSVKTAFAIKACLDRGELVGILADRIPAGSREKPLEVDFLGRPALLPRSPFQLACLLGCPTFVSLCVRIGDAHYRTRVEPLGEGRKLPRRERDKGAEELARAYMARIEQACLRHPYQWFNFHDPWSGAEARRP